MHFLVAGGAGFIGTALCRHLLGTGKRVTCVDNLSSGSKENVDVLKAFDGFEFIRHDIREPRCYPDCDWVVNLACPASPVRYREAPVDALCTSTTGMYNLLECARSCEASVLFTSTSEVYGDPKESPQRESYWGNVDPIGPRSCYDEGKRAAEALCVSYREQYGTDIRVVRLFNVYGPEMSVDDGRIMSSFMAQALLGEDLTVYGDGLQTRSMCYIDDIVEGLVRAITCDSFPSTPVNLGNPDERSVLEIAHAVLAATGSPSKIVHLPGRTGEPRRRVPEISLAKRLLGWEPRVPLEEGMARCVARYSEVLGKGGGR